MVILTACGGGNKNTPATSKTTSPATTAGGGDSLTDILGQGENIGSIKYDMTITAPGVGEVTATIWQKGQKMKEKMTSQGMTIVMIYNMDENVGYMYYQEQNVAMEMDMGEGPLPASPLEESSNILKNNPNITGTETINGKVCMVVEYNIPGAGSVKAWIWKDKGFPIRMETVSSEGTTVIEFTNISFDNIPDSEFELPDDVMMIPNGE
jgi:outer membrane lipoprotein-sorting protein